MAFKSTYVYQNRFGIYCFQKRNPTHILTSSSAVSASFRKSLATRNQREASMRMRILLYIMDKLLNYYWNDADEFARAQKLLHQYKAIIGWKEADEFLAKLDDGDGCCLEKIITYENEVVAKRDLNDSNKSLEQQVTILTEKKIGSDKPLSEVLELFITASQKRWKPQRRESNEHKDYRPKMRLFIEIVGDIAAYDLKKETVAKYRDTLFKLPKNRNKNKRYAGKSIKQLIAMNIAETDLLSNVTLQNHFTKISVFLKWCAENGHTDINLQTPFRNAVATTKQSHEYRDVYTSEDLKALFESNIYKQGRHKKASHFWVPLLSLFSGARENELCQLLVADIQQDAESDIWFIEFCEDKTGDKSIKGSKRRLVPVHKQLIRLGFLDYVEMVKATKSKRLFPEVVKRRDGYAQDFSKWFNRTYRKNCNVGQGDEKRDFHSFRHTLTDYFKQKGCQEYEVCEITGHALPVGLAFGTYGKPSNMKKRSDFLNKLKFDIDFKVIRNWKSHSFVSKSATKT